MTLARYNYRGGIVQLTDDDANRLGAEPVDVEPTAPDEPEPATPDGADVETKRRQPANKARRPRGPRS